MDICCSTAELTPDSSMMLQMARDERVMHEKDMWYLLTCIAKRDLIHMLVGHCWQKFAPAGAVC